MLTENIAILSWSPTRRRSWRPQGRFGRFRLLEMLAFISTEIHKGFKPFFKPDATDAEKAAAGEDARQAASAISPSG